MCASPSGKTQDLMSWILCINLTSCSIAMKNISPSINLKLKTIEIILIYLWRVFLKKICKSVFKQDKYNFTKKIEFGHFHYEKLHVSQKMANPLCPITKRINLLEHSPTIPHPHPYSTLNSLQRSIWETSVNNKTNLFSHLCTCSTVGLTVFNKI